MDEEIHLDAFEVPSHQIVSEIIDGEAVILDLRVGRYYTTDGVGAEVWRSATAGSSRLDIVTSCRSQFPQQGGVEHDIESLLDALVRADLLKPVTGCGQSAAAGWPAFYQAPVLNSYEDLADMLALDPIHDVDATGWPAPGPLVG